MLTRLPSEIIYPGTPHYSVVVVSVMLIGAFAAALRATWLSVVPLERQPATFGFQRCVLIAVALGTIGVSEGFLLPGYLHWIVASDGRRSCGSTGIVEIESSLRSWTSRTHYWSRYAFKCGDGRIFTGTYPIIPT